MKAEDQVLFLGKYCYPISPNQANESLIDKHDQLIKIFEKFIGINPEIDFSFTSCSDQLKYLKKSLGIAK